MHSAERQIKGSACDFSQMLQVILHALHGTADADPTPQIFLEKQQAPLLTLANVLVSLKLRHKNNMKRKMRTIAAKVLKNVN